MDLRNASNHCADCSRKNVSHQAQTLNSRTQRHPARKPKPIGSIDASKLIHMLLHQHSLWIRLSEALNPLGSAAQEIDCRKQEQNTGNDWNDQPNKTQRKAQAANKQVNHLTWFAHVYIHHLSSVSN